MTFSTLLFCKLFRELFSALNLLSNLRIHQKTIYNVALLKKAKSDLTCQWNLVSRCFSKMASCHKLCDWALDTLVSVIFLYEVEVSTLFVWRVCLKQCYWVLLSGKNKFKSDVSSIPVKLELCSRLQVKRVKNCGSNDLISSSIAFSFSCQRFFHNNIQTLNWNIFNFCLCNQ